MEKKLLAVKIFTYLHRKGEMSMKRDDVFRKALTQVYDVVKTVEEGSGYTIFFNPNQIAIGFLIGGDREFCFIYYLANVSGIWVWKDIMNEELDKPLSEAELKRYPDLTFYIDYVAE